MAEYDGSVNMHKINGEISVKCDFEGANFLALNLANDVINGKKTVQTAPDFYTNAVKELVLENKTPPYIKYFQFTVPKGRTSLADKNVVSKEVLKKSRKLR